MTKLSKFSKPKNKAVEKPVKKEVVKKNYAISKSVKNENLNISTHTIIQENSLYNRLVLIAAALIFAVAIFSVVFSILRVENMKNNIIKSQLKIEELTAITLDIDNHNEIFAYNKMFGRDNIYNQSNLTLMLKGIWNYKISISANGGEEEFVTMLNFDQLTEFIQGTSYTVKLYEFINDDVVLPKNIALKGNFTQGDKGDTLDTHFYITGGTGLSKSFTEKETYPDVDGKQGLKIENTLVYQFTAGANTKLEYSIIFRDFMYDYIF